MSTALSTITAYLTPILASEDAKYFLDQTTLGGVLKGFLGAVGVGVVIFVIIKAVGSIAKGSIGPAVKLVLLGAVAAVFLFNPSLVIDLVNALAGVVKSLIGSGSDIIDQKAPSSGG
jgi:hypothetical protein